MFEETSLGKSLNFRDAIIFGKFWCQNVFRPYENAKPFFSNSYGLKSVFEKLCFRDGLVWTEGLTVEINLCFACGRNLRRVIKKILNNPRLSSELKSTGANRSQIRSIIRLTETLLERFSLKCQKSFTFGFALLQKNDWLKNLAPLFHPIRSKTKTNHESLARIFARIPAG